MRSDAIVATGRSDYPNQVNNVLGFPFIFRGALDVRARKINEAMKQAAVHALAELARRGEVVPAGGARGLPERAASTSGRTTSSRSPSIRGPAFVCPAVAQAAMDTRRGAPQADRPRGNTPSALESDAPRSRTL